MTDRLTLTGLRVRAGARTVVTDVSLSVEAGQVVALVGRSGSGKTLTARSLIGLVDVSPGVVEAALEIRVGDEVLHPWTGCLGGRQGARDRAFARVRGRLVGYLPQDARAALDPLWTVGRQVASAAALAADGPIDPLPWLARAGFAEPGRVADRYPHELSGGMAQRVVVAQALARGSRFLVADEPTTGLDSTVQMEILGELRGLADAGIGVLLITHDLRILPGLADEVLLMDAGRIVERMSPDQLTAGTVTSDAARRLVDATRRVAGGRLG